MKNSKNNKTRVFQLLCFSQFVICLYSHGILLEDLVNSGKIMSVLTGNKIAYYPGSFGPFHEGHEYVVRRTIRDKLCNFVLIVPVSWVTYKQELSDIRIRQEALCQKFSNDPQIIVTRYSPYEIQRALTMPHPMDSELVTAKFGVIFIGLLGADTAQFFEERIDKLKKFMKGIKLSKNVVDDSIQEDICIPVDSFIVFDRSGYSFEKNTMADGRGIIKISSEEPYATISSTKIRAMKRSQQ